MPCENYREALIDAAAAGSTPSRELRSHLEACASCRAAFADEMQLFAAIDQSLRVTVNADVPASLLPRVRADLNERPASRRSWIPAFAGVGIAAVLVVALVLARKSARVGVEPNPLAIPSAHNFPSVANPPMTPAIAPQEMAWATRKHIRVGALKTAPAVEAAGVEAEVLIPVGQKRALDVLLAKLRQGELQAEGVPIERFEKPIEILEVSPLDISPIEIKPLPDVNAEAASPESKTKR
ncbi:MAG: hypothetical protein WA639_05775 [Candidatus Acidiferrum sp.]